MNCIVRMCSLTIEGFKNTNWGSFQMPLAYEKKNFVYTADILGIYGQNGSSKTAVIDALQILQKLISGESIKNTRISDLIKQDKKKCILTIGLTIDNQDTQDKYVVDYCVHIAKEENISLIDEAALDIINDKRRAEKKKY